MLPFLTLFYDECMLPEILDSRHNRNMVIRDPKYITDAQEAAKKFNSGRRYMKDKNIIEEKQRCESNSLPMEVTITSVITLSTKQDDDCIIVNYSPNKEELTAGKMAEHKIYIDKRSIELNVIKENVLPVHNLINDESLDLFLRIVREKSRFETQSVLYLEYPHLIEASNSESIQIIGENYTNNWRCIFFDGTKLRVYDSMPGTTYDNLVPKKKNYIYCRYPQISANNIILEKVHAQPDGTSCGIYAAAFATTVALGGNPRYQKYSNRVECMRKHFLKIIIEKNLSPFPDW